MPPQSGLIAMNYFRSLKYRVYLHSIAELQWQKKKEKKLNLKIREPEIGWMKTSSTCCYIWRIWTFRHRERENVVVEEKQSSLPCRRKSWLVYELSLGNNLLQGSIFSSFLSNSLQDTPESFFFLKEKKKIWAMVILVKRDERVQHVRFIALLICGKSPPHTGAICLPFLTFPNNYFSYLSGGNRTYQLWSEQFARE